MKLNKVILSRCRQFIALWTLAGCLLFLVFCTAYADTKYTIYFYNPETNINNFASLKIEFDRYLSDYGLFKFQPFSDRKTFEKFIAGKNDGVFLLSSWHYQSLARKLPIESVLVGVSEGKSMHRKILSTKARYITSIDSLEDIINIDSLEGKSVASSGSEDYTRNILVQMLGEGKKNIVDSLKILTVPKDIDALMAVVFEMASLALTTEQGLTKLMSINLKQYGKLKHLVASKEILLPIIAKPKQPDERVNLLLTVIEEMGTSLEGRKKLKMLGIDGWKRLSKAERISLEEQ